MEVWGLDVIDGRRPKVVSVSTIFISILVHLCGVLAVCFVAWLNGLFEKEDEVVIPIDLTVIVNENLNGVENEPPPVLNPPPPTPPKPDPPKPKTPPKPKIEPPKELEQIVTNVVTKTDKKEEKKKDEKKKDEKKKEDKKKEEKKPAEKKKTREELAKERIDRIRNAAVKNEDKVKIEVKDAKKSGNGKTARQNMTEAEVLKALQAGARPGVTNELAQNETSRCVSLIGRAIEDKWEGVKPRVGRSGQVVLGCKLNSNGGLVAVRVVKSCGDRQSDQAAIDVARQVSSVRGLSEPFIRKHQKEELQIVYKVVGK